MNTYLSIFVVLAVAMTVSGCSPSKWFGRGDAEPQVSDYGAGIEIEELSQDGQDALLSTPVADLETLKLEATSEAADAASGSGVVRYQIEDELVTILVTTDLDTTKAPYSVWVRGSDMDNLTLAFKLEAGKGGAWGSASTPVSRLPLEVLVTSTDSKAEVLDQTILKVIIPKPVGTSGN